VRKGLSILPPNLDKGLLTIVEAKGPSTLEDARPQIEAQCLALPKSTFVTPRGLWNMLSDDSVQGPRFFCRRIDRRDPLVLFSRFRQRQGRNDIRESCRGWTARTRSWTRSGYLDGTNAEPREPSFGFRIGVEAVYLKILPKFVCVTLQSQIIIFETNTLKLPSDGNVHPPKDFSAPCASRRNLPGVQFQFQH
jgi:hypothetical protein